MVDGRARRARARVSAPPVALRAGAWRGRARHLCRLDAPRWLHRQLAFQLHSRAGHRAVHALLVEHGADDTKFREHLAEGSQLNPMPDHVDLGVAGAFHGHHPEPPYVPDSEDEFESDYEEFREERQLRALEDEAALAAITAEIV